MKKKCRSNLIEAYDQRIACFPGAGELIFIKIPSLWLGYARNFMITPSQAPHKDVEITAFYLLCFDTANEKAGFKCSQRGKKEEAQRTTHKVIKSPNEDLAQLLLPSWALIP